MNEIEKSKGSELLGGKVAVITGGASGIGAATAKAFAREGAKVAVFDISDSGNLPQEDSSNRILYLKVDITDEESVQRAVESVESKLGPIDTLINNAGITQLSRRRI